MGWPLDLVSRGSGPALWKGRRLQTGREKLVAEISGLGQAVHVGCAV